MTAYQVVKYAGMTLPPSYLPLIFGRWKRSLRYGNDYFRLAEPASYFAAYDAYIRRILADTEARVRLAVLADDPDIVLGFSVVRGEVLDYVHVSKDYRRIGIGSNLIPDGIKRFSHITKTWLLIWPKKYPILKFNPFV